MKKNIQNKLKKTIIITALAVILAVGGIVGMTTAKAISSSDFYFVFNGVGHWQLTNVREKLSDSYVVMKCTYAEVPGSCYKAVVVSMYDQAACSPIYTFYEGTYQPMVNYVVENAIARGDYLTQYTRIDAWCENDNGGQGAIFGGYWYPDI